MGGYSREDIGEVGWRILWDSILWEEIVMGGDSYWYFIIDNFIAAAWGG